jgi:hypothetical protein
LERMQQDGQVVRNEAGRWSIGLSAHTNGRAVGFRALCFQTPRVPMTRAMSLGLGPRHPHSRAAAPRDQRKTCDGVGRVVGTGKRAIRGFQLALRIQVRRLSSPLFPNSAGPDDQGDVPGPGARHPHSRAAAVLYRRARRGRHPAGSRRRRSCGGAEGKPAGRRGASGCIGCRPRPRWELQIPAHEKPTYDPPQPMLLMRLAGRPRASPGRRPPAIWRRARVR